MFVGRKSELLKLKQIYESGKSELVVVYGKRRIGKSSLIENFVANKPVILKFEAIESYNTKKQIKHFTNELKKQTNDSLLNSVNFDSWENVFNYLSERIIEEKQKDKLILFFDEIQWMAAGRRSLISLIKYFWDKYWKERNILLILCGSIASFMINKIIKSKALYGRITCEILLKGLYPNEVLKLLKNKRSKEEILKYLLIIGSVPKYLEEININKSFGQNINEMYFRPNGIMLNEIDRIFYSQFKESTTYKKIVNILNGKLLSLKLISEKIKIPSGGGLKLYLNNLENAEMIKSIIPFTKKISTKLKKYTLADEYLKFYFKYIEPNIRIIKSSSSKYLFNVLTKDSFNIWMGFAFENFCIKYSAYLAVKMGFGDKMLFASPFFNKNSKKFQIDLFQIDLLYMRSDKVITVCEVKYYNKQINTKIIPEVEKKCKLLNIPRGFTIEKALISIYGPDEALKNSDYFNYYITIDDIFSIS